MVLGSRSCRGFACRVCCERQPWRCDESDNHPEKAPDMDFVAAVLLCVDLRPAAPNLYAGNLEPPSYDQDSVLTNCAAIAISFSAGTVPNPLN